MRVDRKKIKALRVSKGMTQTELANAATVNSPPTKNGDQWRDSISARTIWNMENRQMDHRVLTVMAVAQALEVSMADICLNASNPVERFEQTIFERDGTGIKRDEVHLVDWGDNVVSANIYREAPPTGEEYEFLGKRDDEVIFGHYWATTGHGSSGVLLVQRVGPGASSFSGQYTKVIDEVVDATTNTLTVSHTISHIDLRWEHKGLLSPSATPTGDAEES